MLSKIQTSLKVSSFNPKIYGYCTKLLHSFFKLFGAKNCGTNLDIDMSRKHLADQAVHGARVTQHIEMQFRKNDITRNKRVEGIRQLVAGVGQDSEVELKQNSNVYKDRVKLKSNTSRLHLVEYSDLMIWICLF